MRYWSQFDCCRGLAGWLAALAVLGRLRLKIYDRYPLLLRIGRKSADVLLIYIVKRTFSCVSNFFSLILCLDWNDTWFILIGSLIYIRDRLKPPFCNFLYAFIVQLFNGWKRFRLPYYNKRDFFFEKLCSSPYRNLHVDIHEFTIQEKMGFLPYHKYRSQTCHMNTVRLV